VGASELFAISLESNFGKAAKAGRLGEQQGAKGATAQKQLHETRVFPLLHTTQMRATTVFSTQ
jgi:hypothetical protein